MSMPKNSYLELDLLPYLFQRPPPNTIYSLMLGSEDSEVGLPFGCLKGTSLRVQKPLHLSSSASRLISLDDLAAFIDALNNVLETSHFPSLPCGLIFLPPMSIVCLRKITRYRRQFLLRRLIRDANIRLKSSGVMWKLTEVPPEKFIAGVVIAHLIERQPAVPEAVMPSVLGIPLLPKYSDVLFDSAPPDTVLSLNVHCASNEGNREGNCCFGSISSTPLRLEDLSYAQIGPEARQFLTEDSFLKFRSDLNLALGQGMRLPTLFGFLQCQAERERLVEVTISAANADIRDLPLYWVRSVVPVSLLSSNAPVVHLVRPT